MSGRQRMVIGVVMRREAVTVAGIIAGVAERRVIRPADGATQQRFLTDSRRSLLLNVLRQAEIFHPGKRHRLPPIGSAKIRANAQPACQLGQRIGIGCLNALETRPACRIERLLAHIEHQVQVSNFRVNIKL